MRPGCSGLSDISSIVRGCLPRQHLAITSPSRVRTTTRSLRRTCAPGSTISTSRRDKAASCCRPALPAHRRRAYGREAEIPPRPNPGRRESRHRRKSRRRRLGKAEQRNGRHLRRKGAVRQAHASSRALQERHELFDRGAGGFEDLVDRFRRGPALAAVGGAALGLVEGGGVEPRLARQAGRGQVMPRSQGIDGFPDFLSCENMRTVRRLAARGDAIRKAGDVSDHWRGS